MHLKIQPIYNREMFPLHRNWTLYFHAKNQGKKYAENKEKLIDISDLETFWKTINNMPSPSQMFSDGKTTKILKRTGQTPNALSFFVKGVDPSWEDPKNINGGEWSIRKFKEVSCVDEIWKNLLVDIVGETFEKSERVNGVRVVDCTRVDQNGTTQVMYRIEVWYDSIDDKDFFSSKIKEICSLGPHTKLLFRRHDDVKETIF